MKILIGVPTYGDYLRVNCANALTNLASVLPKFGIDFETSFISVARIEVARNMFASRALFEPGYTHLLFVDSDVGFRPEAVLRMLQKDVGLAACTYPSRKIDMQAFADAARKTTGDVTKILAKALAWPPVGELLETENQVVGGWMKVSQAPTGLMLIKRETLAAMDEHYPELRNDSVHYMPGLPFQHITQLFSPFAREDGMLLGEDISFCRRWRDMGGDIHLLVDETLSHAGVSEFESMFLNHVVD